MTLGYTMAESGCEGTLSIQLFPQMRVFQLSRRKVGGEDVERTQARNDAWEIRRETLLDRGLEGAQGFEADFLPLAELDPETKEQANQAYESLVGTFGYSFEDADRFVYAAMEQDATIFLVFHDAACPEWNLCHDAL